MVRRPTRGPRPPGPRLEPSCSLRWNSTVLPVRGDDVRTGVSARDRDPGLSHWVHRVGTERQAVCSPAEGPHQDPSTLQPDLGLRPPD